MQLLLKKKVLFYNINARNVLAEWAKPEGEGK